MSVLTIDGFIDYVNAAIDRVKAVVEQKKITGYPLYHHAEKWRYITHPNLGEVCPICLKHNERIFRGDEVKTNFPYSKYVGVQNGFRTLRPKTHMPDLSKFADEPCHCDMVLINPVEAFEAQLHVDKLAVL